LKRVEVKAFGVGGFTKMVVYMTVLFAVIVLLFGLGLLWAGNSNHDGFVALFGKNYIVMSILILPIHAAIASIIALIYNMFAKKYGGLVVYVDDDAFGIDESDSNSEIDEDEHPVTEIIETQNTIDVNKDENIAQESTIVEHEVQFQEKEIRNS